MSGDGKGMTEAGAVWDEAASTFDNEPDHGLLDPQVRAAWARLIIETLGPAPLRIADLGCGTGSLSLLLHELGHEVTGLDVSPRMLDKARQKARGAVTFVAGDATQPELPGRSFDVVLCRHVLWALPDARAALTGWAKLLVPGGLICLVEGVWHTGAGMSADQIRAALPSSLRCTGSRCLSDEAALWGASVSDERFLITARLS